MARVTFWSGICTGPSARRRQPRWISGLFVVREAIDVDQIDLAGS